MKKLLAIVIVVLSLLTFVDKAEAGTNESFLITSINSQRSVRGLAPLVVNANLTDLAVNWSEKLASDGALSHSDLVTGVTENWLKLGENVGLGSSAASVATAFIGSPDHLENIIDPSFNTVGVGVTTSGSSLFVVQKFMQTTDQITSKPIPSTTVVIVPPTLPPTTVPPIPSTTIPPATTTIMPEPTITEPPAKIASPVNGGSIFKRFRSFFQRFLQSARVVIAEFLPLGFK